MNRPATYNTRQREAVLSYIESLSGGHATASQIAAHFREGKVRIGRTTVYRLLDKLSGSGAVRRFIIDGVSGACYQYAGGDAACREHSHLKCETCGEVFHLECETLLEAQKHIGDKHTFKVNPARTVLYGLCESCQTKS